MTCTKCGTTEENISVTECCSECEQCNGTDPCPICNNCDSCCEHTSCDGCNEKFEDVCGECGCCESCCECITCEGCDSIISDDEVQGCCNCCDSCCECIFCRDCGNQVDKVCEECAECSDCCDCFYVDRPLEFFVGTSFADNLPCRFTGIELELVNCENRWHVTNCAKTWKMSIVTDGSISGKKGFEINTSPASGDKFLKQITNLTHALNDSEAECDDSCGLHVHVDGRDLSWWTIPSLLRAYSYVEPLLFLMVPKWRWDDNSDLRMCGAGMLDILETKLAGDKEDIENAVCRAIYDAPKSYIENVKFEKRPTQRYRPINLHSWIYQQTVEFRLPPADIDCAHITNWGLLYTSIVDFAIKNPEFRAANTPAPTFLESIVPPRVIPWMYEQLEINHE